MRVLLHTNEGLGFDVNQVLRERDVAMKAQHRLEFKVYERPHRIACHHGRILRVPSR